MNRPRIVGMLSAALGSTTAFLVLSRWSLAGTITGAILMPVIFSLVSFGSHETLERAGKWFFRRIKKDPSGVEAEPSAAETTEMPSAEQGKPRTSGLQWAVVVLALVAFSFSLYSLTQDKSAGVTILHEKVIETVTVTTERPTLSFARSATDISSTTTVLSDITEQPSATTAVIDDQDSPTTTTDPNAEGASPTTVSTAVASGGSTTTTLH